MNGVQSGPTHIATHTTKLSGMHAPYGLRMFYVTSMGKMYSGSEEVGQHGTTMERVRVVF